MNKIIFLCFTLVVTFLTFELEARSGHHHRRDRSNEDSSEDYRHFDWCKRLDELDNIVRIDSKNRNLEEDKMEKGEVADTLIVRKDRKKMYMLENNHVIRIFDVALSYRYGIKHTQGDGRVPEGMYHVRNKKKSNYHNAFEVSYPNEDDINWGRKHIKDFDKLFPNPDVNDAELGKVLGNLVEFHGTGAKKSKYQRWHDQGINWTIGCVAFYNSEIDEIMSHVRSEEEVGVNKATKIEICH